MLLFLFAACAGGSKEPDYSNGDATAGEAIYAQCAVCHGDSGHGVDADGNALAGPDLEEPFTNDEDADLADTIMNGLGEMPAQGLDDTETADVIAYVHSLF
jgi:mono/diheme cytochrome c family protein